MISDHKCTSKADMIAVFPGLLSMIHGVPTMRVFLGVLQHIMVCLHLHEYSLCTLIFLHMCLPVSLYAVHTQEPYPGNVAFPEDVCDFSGIAENDLMTKATRDTEWQCIMKWHIDQNTMSSSLIHHFLSLIHETFNNNFLSVHITNPNI